MSDASKPAEEEHEKGPMQVALARLVSEGTITQQQAHAVRVAVREERQKRKA